MKFTERYTQLMEEVAQEYVKDIEAKDEELKPAIDAVNKDPVDDRALVNQILKLTPDFTVSGDKKLYKDMAALTKKIKDADLQRMMEDHLARIAMDPDDVKDLGKLIPVPEADDEVEVKK